MKRLGDRWLPTSIGLRLGAVRWLEFECDALAEAFFCWAVDKQLSKEDGSGEVFTGLRALMSVTSGTPPVSPAGVIFHVTRCGSTLVANALRAAEDAVVVSEAAAISALLDPNALEEAPGGMRQWAGARKVLMDCVTTRFACFSKVTHPRLIVKCNGTGILELRVARTIWPDVPFVILVREPVEVMVSLLHRGSDWLRFFGKGLAACRTFGWKPEEIRHSSIEEYIARGIGRFCEEVVALQDPRSLIVDYSALRYDGIPRIARFFGLKMPAGDSDELLRVMATYSKDKKRELAFEDDRDAKHGKASGAVRESAERWAQEPYRRLMQMDVLRERRVAFSVCGPCRTGG